MCLGNDFFRRSGPEFYRRGYTGLTKAHSVVLTHLPLGGARVTDLARTARVTKQAIGPLVTDMERLGYVERLRDPSDARAKIVRFTEKGLGLVQDAREVVAETWSQYAEILGEERLEAVREGLDEILARLDQARDD
ncbi:MAG: MarR family winged helix-turn-helix transcriptional regulator [Candidatus Binatia bacterium]|nr:MarR family winged helix-turn-helix transcriptional regulator [Candidatus Binatia bacterium]